jgi:hypothetical protein
MAALISAQDAANPANPIDDMVLIPGGTFRMGSDRHYPEKAPEGNGRSMLLGGGWSVRPIARIGCCVSPQPNPNEINQLGKR